MNQFIKAKAFLKYLFDQDRLAAKAAVIVEAILAALVRPAYRRLRNTCRGARPPTTR